MTTGRINQVTTFRSAFAAIIYSRATNARFRDAEFIITFCVEIHPGSTQTFCSPSLHVRGEGYYHGLIEPADGITSFPILTHLK